MPEDTATAAVEARFAAEDAAAAANAADGTPGADPYDTGADTFDRSYVEKLRQENARYRTAAKQYEEVFSPYNDEARAEWFEVIQTLAKDPQAGAQYMLDVAESILGTAEGEGVQNAGAAAAAATQAVQDGALTQADLVEFMQEWSRQEREERALNDATSAILREAHDLGYNEGTPEFVEVMYLTAHQTGGDVKAAHDFLVAREQAAVERYLAGRTADANGTPRLPVGGAPVGNRPTEIKTWEDAERAAYERLGGYPEGL
jgi:hypothetical protein